MNEFVRYYTKNNLITHWKIRDIDRFYSLNRQQLLDAYNQAFIALFRKAFTESPFYKEFYQSHGIQIGDIKDLSDLKKLPEINRLLIQDKVNDIYNGYQFLKVKGLTSGTTGTPLTVYRSPVDIATEQAYIRHYRALHGFQAGEPLLSIRGFLGKQVTHEYFKKANILYISSPNINADTIEFYYKLIQDFKPKAVEAFPSYLTKFVTELDRKNLPLQIPFSFTSSEMLYRHQRDKIEPYLQTTIHDWYGNVERTIALAQNKDNEYYPLPLYSINEFAPDKLVTTGLINRNFPLIRYKVTDIVPVESDDFYENLLAPRIVRIEGRQGDNIDLKDGSVVGCPDHAFKGVDYLDAAQIHQYHVQEPILIKLVTKPGFSKNQEDQLRANFLRLLGPDMDLRFEYCSREDLTLSASNKFNLIIKKKPVKA